MLIVAVVGVLNWLLCCLSVCVFDCFMLEFCVSGGFGLCCYGGFGFSGCALIIGCLGFGFVFVCLFVLVSYFGGVCV